MNDPLVKDNAKVKSLKKNKKGEITLEHPGQ